VKFLPDGEPVQLTHDNSMKMSPVFTPEGSRAAYTVIDGFNWQTYEVPVTGGEPRLLLPNASGLTWLDREHLLFSEIKSGAHMGLVTATESRSEERDVYLPRGSNGQSHLWIALLDRRFPPRQISSGNDDTPFFSPAATSFFAARRPGLTTSIG